MTALPTAQGPTVLVILDGFGYRDSRTPDMVKWLTVFQLKVPDLKIFSITPSQYPVQTQSVYSYYV